MPNPIHTVMACCMVGGLAAAFFTSPPNTFNPFCTYDLNYRFTATIEVDGTRYTSAVTHQTAHSRSWIQSLNSGGCQSNYGTALPFRLKDNRAVLLRARICPEATDTFGGIAPRERGMKQPDYARAMREQRVLIVSDYCIGMAQNMSWRMHVKPVDGFLLDSADQPTLWEGFYLDGAPTPSNATIHLVSATAQALYAAPADDLGGVVPGALKASFESGRNGWWDSPESILPFNRRTFTYKAKEH